MYYASSGERHMRSGSEKPLLYMTHSSKVNRATLFMTLCASSESLSSLPSYKNSLMSMAH